MSVIPAALRHQVVLRAGNRCEYCRLSQAGQEATFHIDHVIPRAAGGPTTLALNRPLAVAIRHEEIVRGRHPPPAGGSLEY